MFLFCSMYDAPPDTQEDPAAPVPETPAAWRQQVLQQLAEFGMQMAQALVSQAQAEAPAQADEASADPKALKALADIGAAFARVSRSVRQTLALHARFEDDARPAPVRKVAPQPQGLDTSGLWRVRRRKEEVRSLMEQVIRPDTHFRDSDKLRIDLMDWLDDDADDEDFADTPTTELVARICRDLGIVPDWNLLKITDWALDDPPPEEVPPPAQLQRVIWPEPPEPGDPEPEPALEMAGGWQPP